MSDTNSESDTYKQDPRMPCKYGDKCYQKNVTHQNKYKHPPKKFKRKHNPPVKPSKRVKVDDEATKPPNDVSTTLEDDNPKQTSITTLSQEKTRDDILLNSSEKKDETSKQHMSSNEARKMEYISSSASEESDETSENITSDSIPVGATSYENKDETVPTRSNKLKKESEAENTEQEKISTKPFNPKMFIKTKFLVDMPNDFYEFWEFCKQLKPTNPSEALNNVGLKLVGPYDVLAGKFMHTRKSPEEYLRHWRYYYDTPEVFTVIKGDDKTGYHIGYFYDSPDEAPSFLVSNHGLKNGVFTKMGDNIFAAISLYLEELKKTGDPFKKMHVGKLLSAIKVHAEKMKLNLSPHSKKIKERGFKVVANTFNKIGIVVPYNKKTELGYRDLAMQDKELITLLTKLEKAAPEQKSKYLSDLQPVLTYANIALDECDFGTGVKLGWELLYHGIDSLNSTISQFLANSYRLLNKETFAKIAEAHMSQRKRGCDLSVI